MECCTLFFVFYADVVWEVFKIYIGVFVSSAQKQVTTDVSTKINEKNTAKLTCHAAYQ